MCMGRRLGGREVEYRFVGWQRQTYVTLRQGKGLFLFLTLHVPTMSLKAVGIAAATAAVSNGLTCWVLVGREMTPLQLSAAAGL